MRTDIELNEDIINPIDNVESMMNANNWTFRRITDEELMVEIAGKRGSYNLFFLWQEDLNALQFCAQYDITIAAEKMEQASPILRQLNEDLWMGHFDIPAETGIPSFRHTCLYRGIAQNSGTDHLEDLVEIAIAQCERSYSAFSFLAHGNNFDPQSLSLVMMQTQGES